MSQPQNNEQPENSLYPNIIYSPRASSSDSDSSTASTAIANDNATNDTAQQTSGINSGHEFDSTVNPSASSSTHIHGTHKGHLDDNFHNKNDDSSSILSSLTRTKKNKNLAPVFTRDYYGGSGTTLVSDKFRKGWKGLTSLEKSLSVSLGVVSTISVALMIAVIVVGVQLNERENCKLIPVTPVPITCAPTQEPPDDRCSTTERPRPIRKPDVAEAKASSNWLLGGSVGGREGDLEGFCKVKGKKEVRNKTVCLTPGCSRVAGEILRKGHFEVNACENFYEFACGGELKTGGAMEGRGRLLQQVKNILQVREGDEVEEEGKEVVGWGMKLARKYYHSCMNPLKDDEVSLEEMKMLVYAMTNVAISDGADKWSGLAALLGNLRKYLKLDLVVKLEVHESIGVVVKKPVFGLEALVKDLGVGGGRMEEMSEETQERLREYYGRLGKKLWVLVYPEDTRDVEKIWGELETFEGKLRMLAMGADQNTAGNYNLLLEDLKINQQLNSTVIILLTDFVNNLMREPNDMDKQTLPSVVVKNLNYFQGLEIVLNETSGLTIKKYLKMRTLLSYASHSGEIFKELFGNFKKYVEGQNGHVHIPRWQTCAEEATNYFGWAVSQHLVNGSISQFAILKQQLHEAETYLKESFNETLTVGLPWIATNETRENAKVKLDAMQIFLGFPTEWMKLLKLGQNNSENVDGPVESFYSDMNFTDPLNYLQNFVEIRIWLASKELGQLNNTKFTNLANSSSWPMFLYPSGGSAIYQEYLNQLTLPFGAIDTLALGDFSVPAVVYGNVASLMANYMFQGFDNYGDTAIWWDANTTENYQAVQNCYRSQYFESNSSMAIADQLDYDLDRENQKESKLLRQVILENAAIRLAYNAYHSKTFNDRFDEHLLPGLQAYSPEQLYFLSFAQSHCHNPRLVNNVFGNSVQFARHWKCPLPTLENLCTVL